MGHPRDDIGPLRPTENTLELGGELLEPHGMSVVDGAGSGSGRHVRGGSDGGLLLLGIGRVFGAVSLDTVQVGNGGVVLVLVGHGHLQPWVIVVACAVRGGRHASRSGVRGISTSSKVRRAR